MRVFHVGTSRLRFGAGGVQEETTAPEAVEMPAQGVAVGETDETIELCPEEAAESVKPRIMTMPPAPSRQEVPEHNVTHCPLRA